MPNLTASIPHHLTRAEAKRRIQAQLAVLRQEHGTLVPVQETWTGDTMAFAVNVMGQSINGNLKVEDQIVHLDVALPWFLNMLAGSVKQQLEQQGRRLLTGPANEPSRGRKT